MMVDAADLLQIPLKIGSIAEEKEKAEIVVVSWYFRIESIGENKSKRFWL